MTEGTRLCCLICKKEFASKFAFVTHWCEKDAIKKGPKVNLHLTRDDVAQMRMSTWWEQARRIADKGAQRK